MANPSQKKSKQHLSEKQFHHMLNTYIGLISGYIEIMMGCIILAVIVILSIDLVVKFPAHMFSLDSHGFTDFLSSMLTLVVGLEFVKMLCMHTPETVIEVLMFATARQMVVEHLDPFNTLIGVLTIGVLFAIRKYLVLSPLKKKEKAKATEQMHETEKV